MTDRTTPTDKVRDIINDPSISATDAVNTTTKNISTPALPGRWRCAKHPHQGIVIVTTDPDTYGYVYCVILAPEYNKKVQWLYCNNNKLTYLDTTELPDNWLPSDWRFADHPDYERVIVTTAPNLRGNVYFMFPTTMEKAGFYWFACQHNVLTYIDTNQ